VRCFNYGVHGKLPLRGYEGRVIGYTNSHQIYRVIDQAGKTKLAKIFQPVQTDEGLSEPDDSPGSDIVVEGKEPSPIRG